MTVKEGKEMFTLLPMAVYKKREIFVEKCPRAYLIQVLSEHASSNKHEKSSRSPGPSCKFRKPKTPTVHCCGCGRAEEHCVTLGVLAPGSCACLTLCLAPNQH